MRLRTLLAVRRRTMRAAWGTQWTCRWVSRIRTRRLFSVEEGGGAELRKNRVAAPPGRVSGTQKKGGKISRQILKPESEFEPTTKTFKIVKHIPRGDPNLKMFLMLNRGGGGTGKAQREYIGCIAYHEGITSAEPFPHLSYRSARPSSLCRGTRIPNRGPIVDSGAGRRPEGRHPGASGRGVSMVLGHYRCRGSDQKISPHRTVLRKAHHPEHLSGIRNGNININCG